MHKKLPPKFLMNVGQYLKDFVRSVDGCHITNFFHDITYGHNQISMLTTDAEMLQFYYENNIPVACTNESGRTLADGLYVKEVLTKQNPEYIHLLSVLYKAGLKRDIYYGKNALHYVIRESDCQHMFTLFFDLSDHEFLHFVINQRTKIEDFIHQYNFVAKDIILEAKSSVNRITLPSMGAIKPKIQLNWDSIFQYSSEQWGRLLTKPRYSFTLKMGATTLSRQEIMVSVELLKGKHAGEIAHTLNIKQTTVESYLQNIKNKLGVSHKAEIIQQFIDLRLLHQINDDMHDDFIPLKTS